MRLYVQSPLCGHRIYLNIVADTRHALAQHIGSQFFNMSCPLCGSLYTYSVNDVYAEPAENAAPAGAILGGLVGALIAGPIGLLIGGGGGLLVAGTQEQERVRRFNSGV